MKEIIAYVKKRVREQIDYYVLPKSLILILFFVSFLGGIILGNLFFSGDFGGLSFVLLLLVVLIRKFLRINCKIFLLIFLGVVLGTGRLYLVSLVSADDVSHYLGKGLLKACISEEVDVRNDQIKYTVEASEFQKEGQTFAVSGLVMVTGGRYPVYEYGDCLLIEGELRKPDVIEDFDYGKYLSRYGIYAVIYQAKIEKLNSGSTFDLLKLVFQFKIDFESRLSKVFAEPYAGFMAGLILGSRRGISDELTQKFNATGLSHIVAVSGYNITMLIVVVSGIFGFLERKKKVIGSLSEVAEREGTELYAAA